MNNFIRNLEIKIVGLIVLVSGTLYLSWMFMSLNWDNPVLALLFALANILAAISIFIAIINYTSFSIPEVRLIEEDDELPIVGVIIPTYKEPVDMVRRTAVSVLTQNYPEDKIVLIISDDAHDVAVKAMVHNLDAQYVNANILYFEPPLKDDPNRRGEAKSGNLNAVYDKLLELEDIQYIETRDADDEVGHPDFLRHALAHLIHNTDAAYVQTIKEVATTPGDPFGNLEGFFYRSLMLSKNKTKSVFPCGSGLVWRKDALVSIGGFPIWNVVEDFQSGAEAMRRGWRGIFIPIVGAIGQVSPEDIESLYKQRGTWALDSIRYMLYGDKSGMNIRQKLNMIEPGLAYITSIASIIFALIPVMSLLFGIGPLSVDSFEYFLYLGPYMLSMNLFMYLRALRSGVSMGSIIRSYQTLFGLSPVYFRAFLQALKFGRNRKPKYIVTRKTHKHGVYLKDVYIQLVVVMLLFLSITGEFSQYFHYGESIDFFTTIWAVFYLYLFQRIVMNSIHGVTVSSLLGIKKQKYIFQNA